MGGEDVCEGFRVGGEGGRGEEEGPLLLLLLVLCGCGRGHFEVGGGVYCEGGRHGCCDWLIERVSGWLIGQLTFCAMLRTSRKGCRERGRVRVGMSL